MRYVHSTSPVATASGRVILDRARATPMDSVALTLAHRLISLRILAVPPSSRREDLYVRYVRPFIKRVLLHRDGARAEAAAPQVQAMRPGLPLRHDDIREILLVKTDHIGDFLVSLGSLDPEERLSLRTDNFALRLVD